MSENASPLHPHAMPVELVARLLSTAGKRIVSVDTIRRDLAAGAPVNPDGTVNLVHYAAWLAKELGNGD